jgi:predicted HTH domain antitoxin
LFRSIFLQQALAEHYNQSILLLAIPMSTVQITIPEEVLISLKQTPDILSRELCLLAAIKLFELGRLSSGRAAQLAGITRVEFLNGLGRYQVSPFTLSAEELAQDLQNA